MTWSKSSAVRWLGSGTNRSDTLTLPAGGSSVCSHTFTTTRSAPCSAASAAAQVSAVRLPGDPSTPTTMVFHSLTVVSPSSVDAPALLGPAWVGRLSWAPAAARESYHDSRGERY